MAHSQAELLTSLLPNLHCLQKLPSWDNTMDDKGNRSIGTSIINDVYTKIDNQKRYHRVSCKTKLDFEMPTTSTLLLLLASSCVNVIEAFDFSKVDYCQLTCYGAKNTLCGCGNSELDFWHEVCQEVDDIVKFRQDVLDAHNELREQIASGYEMVEWNLTSASNMMVFSYDLELERGARCFIKGHVRGHDQCRRTSRFEHAGQNIAAGSNQRDVVKDRIRAWYIEEIKNVLPETIDYFQTPKGKNLNDVGHFTQFVWATDTHVGCATGFRYNASNLMWRWIIICNYGGPIGGNMATGQVYKKGKACSACPKGKKCNKKYKNLCGEVEPIPRIL